MSRILFRPDIRADKGVSDSRGQPEIVMFNPLMADRRVN